MQILAYFYNLSSMFFALLFEQDRDVDSHLLDAVVSE
jgi:hypothetical protein